ncbi:MAG: hypothetical protein RLZZ58_1248 [Pseudomonadota bacterium]
MMKRMMMTLAALTAVTAAPAHADVISLNSGSVGQSFTIDYNGYTGSGEIAGLTGSTTLTLTATTANSYTFSYTANNTSSAPITDSRISGFGFDVDPTISGATSTGTFSTTALSANVPNVGTVDVCFKSGGGTNSCAGGGGGGVSIGDNGSGTLTLSFAAAATSISLSDFFVRYQSIAGAGAITSAVGTGTITGSSGGTTSTSTGGTQVPEPGMLGLFGLGLLGLGLAQRRRRTLAA